MRVFWPITIAAAALVGLLAYGIAAKGTNTTLDQAIAKGERPPAPVKALPRLGANGQASLADYRGKVVVLNVWASWCVPCGEEVPLLQKTHENISKQGGVVLGVDTQDATGAALEFLKKHKADFPSLRDKDRSYVHELGVTGYPETFLIDRDGRVVALQRAPVTQQWLDQHFPDRAARVMARVREMRGGNTHWSGGVLRFAYDDPREIGELLPDVEDEFENFYDGISPYSKDDYHGDLMRVTSGRTDPVLSKLLVHNSFDTVKWMKKVGGIKMEPAITLSAVKKDNVMVWARGLVVRAEHEGVGLSRSWFATAEKRGIEIRYGTAATELLVGDDGRISGVKVRDDETYIESYPISIAWPSNDEFAHMPSVPECRSRVYERLGLPPQLKLAVGVDRFDYTKGILERLHAVERMLEKHPECVGLFSFVQVAAPTRSSLLASSISIG